MASIRPILKSPSSNSTVYIRLKQGRGIDLTVKTNFVVDSAKWDKNKCRPKTSSSELKVLKNEIDSLCNHIQEKSNLLSMDGLDPSKLWLENTINKFYQRESKEQNASISYWIEYLIQNSQLFTNSIGEKGLSKNRVKHYKTLLGVFNRFEGSHNYKVKEITQLFYDQFFNWLKINEGYKHNTAKKLSDDLIAVARHSIKFNIPVSNELHYIERVKVRRQTPIVIEESEIELIKKASLESDYLINTRKWLLLGLKLAQRVSDLLPLTDDNIKYVKNLDGDLVKCILFKQKKSQNTKEIVYPFDDELTLLLKDGFPRKISDQKFNKYIKEVCKIAGLNKLMDGSIKSSIEVNGKKVLRDVDGTFQKWELITSHTMRKTATTHYYQKLGSKVKHITGHSKEETVNIYVNDDISRKVSQIQQMQLEIDKNSPVSNIAPVLKVVKSKLAE